MRMNGARLCGRSGPCHRDEFSGARGCVSAAKAVSARRVWGIVLTFRKSCSRNPRSGFGRRSGGANVNCCFPYFSTDCECDILVRMYYIFDEKTGKYRETWPTFKYDGERYYYLGNCFAGEEVEHGREIPIVG